LAIDLDPQASLSTMLLSRERADAAAEQGRSISHLLATIVEARPVNFSKLMTTKASDIVELRDAADRRRVDLVASNRQLLAHLSELETRLRQRYGERLDKAVAAALEPALSRLDKSYDVVIFDTAAGTGPLALAAVRLSSMVISPTVLDTVSLDALRDFIGIVLGHDDTLANFDHYVLATLFRAGDPEQRLKLDHIRAGLIRLQILPAVVSDTVHVRRATERIRPDSFRTAREKYDEALRTLDELANAVMRIRPLRGNRE
jgi:cellulose biosynthesis protein BcsQ